MRLFVLITVASCIYALPTPTPAPLSGLLDPLGLFGGGAKKQSAQKVPVKQPIQEAEEEAEDAPEEAQAANSAAIGTTTTPSDPAAAEARTLLEKISKTCQVEVASATGCMMGCLIKALGAKSVKKGMAATMQQRVCLFDTCKDSFKRDQCRGEATLLGVDEVRKVSKFVAETAAKHTSQVLEIGVNTSASVKNVSEMGSTVTGKLATG
jgi:hypothetical protein